MSYARTAAQVFGVAFHEPDSASVTVMRHEDTIHYNGSIYEDRELLILMHCDGTVIWLKSPELSYDSTEAEYR